MSKLMILRWVVVAATIAAATYIKFPRTNADEVNEALRTAKNELIQLEERIRELRRVVQHAKDLSQN
jgi:hypothetical protein